MYEDDEFDRGTKWRPVWGVWKYRKSTSTEDKVPIPVLYPLQRDSGFLRIFVLTYKPQHPTRRSLGSWSGVHCLHKYNRSYSHTHILYSLPSGRLCIRTLSLGERVLYFHHDIGWPVQTNSENSMSVIKFPEERVDKRTLDHILIIIPFTPFWLVKV